MPLNAHPPTRRRRRLRRQGRRGDAAARRWTSRSGAGSCPATSTGSTSSPSAASSASRRSCATRGSTTSRRSTTTCSAPACERAAALGLPVAVHAERPSRAARAARRRAGASGPRRGRRPPSWPRSSARSSSRRRPAARCTSCTSRSATGVAAVAEARGARRRRHLRDLPALPRARATTTWSGSARSPSARRRCGRGERRGAVGAARRRRSTLVALRPLALPAGHEGRRLRRRLGRDRRRADDAARCCSARALRRGGCRSTGSPTSSPARPPRRFRLPGKGRLEAGADADLALVDLGGEHPRRRAPRPPPGQPVRGPRAARPRRPYAAARAAPCSDGRSRPAARPRRREEPE